jgi:hypothetical protein
MPAPSSVEPRAEADEGKKEERDEDEDGNEEPNDDR